MFKKLAAWLFGTSSNTPASAKPLGFFSTDLSGIVSANPGIMHAAWARTFMRTPDDMTVQSKDAQGRSIAMDATPLQNTKAAFSGFQVAIPEAQFGWYASQGFLGYQMCAMLSQNWLIDKACTMPARDAIRNGFDIVVENGKEVPTEKLDQLKKMDLAMKLNDHMVEFVRFARIFGIRVAMFQVDNPDPLYYELPFNPDGVKPGSYKGISQIDPYWMSPLLDLQAASNPAAKDFYEPTWWIINGKKIHKSHLIIMRTCEVPDILKPTYFYGGIPLTQKIYERVYAAERTANEAPLLAMTKRSTVIHTDMAAALANEVKFTEKMQIWARYRDNFGIKVLGTDEVAEQFDTSLADLDEVIMTQYQIVAAIAEVPATKLLGTTPKGFNATGEYEEASYHEMLESIQSHDLSRLIDRHHLLCIRSDISPGDPFEVSTAWKPVDSPTAKEQAEINEIKARTGTSLVNSGAISSMEERERVSMDPDSGYAALPMDIDPEELAPEEVEEDPQDPEADKNAE